MSPADLLSVIVMLALVLACCGVFLAFAWMCAMHARTQEILRRIDARTALRDCLKTERTSSDD